MWSDKSSAGALTAWLLAVLTLLPAGAAEPPASLAGSEVRSHWALGRLQPAGAVKLRAPVPAADGRPLRIEQLVADGTAVAAGDPIAVFGHSAIGRQRRAERALRRAEDDRERELARLRRQLGAMESDAALAALEVNKAELEKSKTGVLARRDAELVELAARRAAFELDAVRRRLEAQREVLRAVEAEWNARIEQAQGRSAAATAAVEPLRLLAPAAGRVFAVAGDDGRPIAAGQRLEPGAPVVVLATRSGLVVEFELPETAWAAMRVGRALTLLSLDGRRETFVRVESLGPFSRRGSGRAEAAVFRVRAELPVEQTGFRPGQLVRVGP